MTYQDEFARRLGNARAAATGEDTAESRHPELVSGPRTAEPADRGKTDEILKQVQDDELTPPSRLREGPGVGPGETANAVPDSISVPTPDPSREREGNTPTTRHDGWLPDIRVKFLEALSRTGNVGAAAYYVQRSRQSAYDLRRRDPDFARGWQAALVLARDVAEDALQERAIDGIEEPVYYHGEVVGMRRRYDSRLLLAHLARLDKIAEQVPARRAAARFEELMEAIRTGADSAPLIAVPTDDELAAAAAQAEVRQPAAEEQGEEFYAVRWPDADGPPDYYRLTPEEAAEMEGEVPGLTATPTGTRSDAVITSLHFDELARAEAAAKAKAAEDDAWPDWDTAPDPRELN
tara:strand:- start:116605 stop:117654 length:1050 start_codon:yes stop_codon:yes gene_type:complete